MDSILDETIQFFMENHHTKDNQDPRTEEAVKNLCEREEALVQSFSEEQVVLFDEYTKAINKVQWLQQDELKRLAFVFGARLAGEVEEVFQTLGIRNQI